MGYESVEMSSLKTLEIALEGYLKYVAAVSSSQTRKDVEYELKRVKAELAMYG